MCLALGDRKLVAAFVLRVAYELGFKYPAHFTRLFKNVVGCTPNRYRSRFD